MGNPKIKEYSKPFSKSNQPDKDAVRRRVQSRKKNIKKRRELAEILNLALKGKIGNQINDILNDLGVKASTIEEALHFVQIAKAISNKDTQAYMALMQTSGLNKPEKIEHSGQIATPYNDSQVDKILNSIRAAGKVKSNR